MTLKFNDELNELKAALVAGKHDLQAMLDLPDVKSPPQFTTPPLQNHVTSSAIESIIILAAIVYKMELHALTVEAMDEYALDVLTRHQRNLLRKFDIRYKTRILESIHRQLIHGKSIGWLCDLGSTPKKTIEKIISELEMIETDFTVMENLLVDE